MELIQFQEAASAQSWQEEGGRGFPLPALQQQHTLKGKALHDSAGEHPRCNSQSLRLFHEIQHTAPTAGVTPGSRGEEEVCREHQHTLLMKLKLPVVTQQEKHLCTESTQHCAGLTWYHIPTLPLVRSVCLN